jgi:Got1/Sft2-like family
MFSIEEWVDFQNYKLCCCHHYVVKRMMVTISMPTRSKSVFKISFLVLTLAITSAELGRQERCKMGWTFPHKGYRGHGDEHFLYKCDETIVSFLKLLTARGGAGGFERDYTSRNYNEEQNRENQRFNNNYVSSQHLDNGGKYDEYYDDDYRQETETNIDTTSTPKKFSKTTILASMTSLPSVLKNGDRKMGVGCLGSGLLITMLGITLFFNRTLMRIGNILFIAGIPLTIGPTRTIGYFAQPEKIRSTSCLLLGILLVFMGHPMFGIALEIFGLLNLFGNMFPFLLLIAKQFPGINTVFNASSRITPTKNERINSQQDDNEDYLDYLDSDTRNSDLGNIYDAYQYSSRTDRGYDIR